MRAELPPRARRIQETGRPPRRSSGTTSACAENTIGGDYLENFSGNYLRVRGEYRGNGWSLGISVELPPRARRIPVTNDSTPPYDGTTSACAENTTAPWNAGITPWNYLRVRGEYHTLTRISCSVAELPPRARRIHGKIVRGVVKQGTTSACAENTNRCKPLRIGWRNYLRVRGEYQGSNSRNNNNQELPPRARRIHIQKRCNLLIRGTTSACAENTISSISSIQPPGNYLRVRGEYPS